MDTPRDSAIHQAQEARAAKDTLILQKVNAAHREAFIQKFPGQVDHIMRLVAERLQLGLRKDQSEPLSNSDVDYLARALYNVYQVHKDIHND